MNFWASMWSPIRSWFGGRQTSGTQITGPDGYGYSAAVDINEETALQISSVWACVRLISQAVASLPILVYRKTPKGREVDSEHWFAKMMAGTPNQYQTRFEFWEHQVANLALHGNLYAKKIKRAGAVIGLLPLNPLQVETVLVGGVVKHAFKIDGTIVGYSADDVWHAKMNGDLIVGRSPLQFGRNIFSVASAAEQAVTKVYDNGGKRSGVLSIDKFLTHDQRNQIRANFNEVTSGTEDRLLVLEGGMKFEPVSMSPQDIELLASRRFQVEEICRWFGVPSVLVNDTTGSTTWGSGIAQIMDGFYKLNLRPYLEALECSITSHLFSESERGKYEVEFDFEGLLRATQNERFNGYQVGIAGGFLTPNEARAREWMPAVPGGDSLYIQGAMVPILDTGGKKESGEDASKPVIEGEDVQQTALNGAQVTSLQGIVAAVASGELPADTAEAIIAAAFPLLSPAQVSAMIKPLRNFKPKPKESEPA